MPCIWSRRTFLPKRTTSDLVIDVGRTGRRRLKRLTTMTVVLFGSAWVGVSRTRYVLAPDWNDGVLYGDLGDYFLLLTMKQFDQSDCGGAQRRLRHQFVDSIRKCGLQPPQGEPLDVVAVKEILIEFAGKHDKPGLALQGAQHCTSPGGDRGHKLYIERQHVCRSGRGVAVRVSAESFVGQRK